MGRRPEQFAQGVTRKKKIDKESIGTCLFVADKLLLEKEVERTGQSRSEILRNVFHAHAMKRRFGVTDTDEASVVTSLKKLATELAGAREDLQNILKQNRTINESFEGFEELSQTEFSRMLASHNAQYNLSAQSFATLWALLDFFRRFVADPMLARESETKDNPHAASGRQIQEARAEGLQVVERITEEIQSPLKPKMVLIGPQE